MTVVERFIDACNQHQFQLSEKQINQFATYFELLVEWNEKMNLTAIVDEEGVYFKHFFDSLTIGFQ
ncbi:MAG: RsmG family class I SAM-dependent methyltransferase, partial [Bacilli bacterium]